jgi:hypothetical protein
MYATGIEMPRPLAQTPAAGGQTGNFCRLLLAGHEPGGRISVSGGIRDPTLFMPQGLADRLLDDQVVPNVLHPGNGPGVLAGGGLLLCGVHKAAELHDLLDRLDTDRE